MEKPANPPPYTEHPAPPAGFIPPPHQPPNATGMYFFQAFFLREKVEKN